MSAGMPRRPESEHMDAGDVADVYAQADFAEVNAAFVERLLALVGPAARARAVDLCTGPADIPIRLVRARPGWRVVGVDASTAMLAHAGRAVARAGLLGAVELVQADVKATGLAAASFDVIFSNGSLHHINDTAAFWAEAKRLAKPGATVFVRDLARPTSEAEAQRIVETHAGREPDLLKAEFFRSLVASHTADEVGTQLRAAGLRSLAADMSSDRHLDVVGRLP